MALIRVPKSAEPLLAFCKPNYNRHRNIFFETYAEFIIFVAAYGFYKKGTSCIQPANSFMDQPNPIDMAIFKNQHLFPLIILLGITLTGTYEIIRKEEDLARIIENYAEAGCHELAILLKKSTSESFHIELANLIQEIMTE